MPPNQKKPIALFDLDNTLADYNTALKAGMADIAAPGEQPFQWPTSGDLDDLPDHIQARKHLITRQAGFWQNLPLHRPGFDLLELALGMGFKIHILTRGPGRHALAWAEKLEWVREHVDPITGVHTPITITCHDKEAVSGAILVDDWPDYTLPWLKAHPQGRVIFPMQPWNEEVMTRGLPLALARRICWYGGPSEMKAAEGIFTAAANAQQD